MIPEAGRQAPRAWGSRPRRDRVVQAALKLVLEPIFEADFKPCSYGFRPRRRAQDAIAEIHHFALPQLRVGAGGRHHGVLRRDRPHRPDGPGATIGSRTSASWAWSRRSSTPASSPRTASHRDTKTGTPQGGILSPLLANIALSVLDEHFAEAWETMGRLDGAAPTATPGTGHLSPGALRGRLRRAGGRHPRPRRRAARRGGSGARPDRAAPVGGEDDDRPHRRGVRLPRLPHPAADQARVDDKRYVYTWPSKKALASIKAKVQGDHPSRHEPAARRPAAPAQPGAAGLDHLLPARRVQADLQLPRRTTRGDGSSDGCAASTAVPTGSSSDGATCHTGGARPTAVDAVQPASVPVTRYRYRGTKIPTPWTSGQTPSHDPATRTRGEPDAVEAARPVREAGRGNGPAETPAPRPGPTLTALDKSDVIWRFVPARPPLDRGPVTGDDGLAEASLDVVLDGEILLQIVAHTGGAELWSTQHQCSALCAVRVESDDRLDVLRAPRPCPHAAQRRAATAVFMGQTVRAGAANAGA